MNAGSRRKFLRDSIGATGAALAGASASAASTARIEGANDRIRVGLIGCGGMGRSDLRDFVKVKNVECVGLCDVDDAQVAKAQAEILDAESVRQKAELTTRDFRRVLDRKDIDAVIVATPDHWHALPTILACQAGKDVYVEKPLSVCIAEGRAMVGAARKNARVVQMGTHQRSATHYTDAVDYVKSGKLGSTSIADLAPLHLTARPTSTGRAKPPWWRTVPLPRGSTTTCGWARPRRGPSTRTASTSPSAGTGTTRAGS